MSLRNLLPIGRAFVPTAERTGRYRPAEAGVLPVFAETRVPAAASETSASTAEPSGARPAAEIVRDAGRVDGLEAASRRAKGLEQPGRGRGWRLPAWLERWLLHLLRPGNRRRGTRPVQTEMCFRTLKVARNDLTTADVEVVMVGPAKRGTGMSAACRARLFRLWWTQGARRWKRWGNLLF